jgi:hypothetical protein
MGPTHGVHQAENAIPKNSDPTFLLMFPRGKKRFKYQYKIQMLTQPFLLSKLERTT